MFKLEDGRETLWQWDIDRRIIVNDEKICEVHFCNRTSDCSLVVEVIDGYANIPNILLQDARPIRAYAYCDDKYTLTEQQFTVKTRTKPADYVYTETEILQYSTLGNRINELQEQVEAVDVSNFYTRAETDTAISDAKEVFYFNFDYNSWTKASDEAVAVFNRLINGEQLIVCLKGMYSYAVADICVQNANSIIFKTHFTDAIGTNTTVNEYLASYYNNSWDVKRQSTSSNSYATQTYVTTAINDALAGIATAEGGSY